MKTLPVSFTLAILSLSFAFASRAFADPLPGEVLKFQQLPLNQGLPAYPGAPTGQPFNGHDEVSTAYATVPPIGAYQGPFMADDFSDTVSRPVVHVRWWGSYPLDANGQQQFGNAGVPRFLMSFESDMPFDPNVTPNGGSRPDQPLSTQVVTRGALAPASGTFTETLINGNMPEHLYQYNAELSVPFPEQANTVYWLKIVALVDPNTTADGNVLWGWHDRDWGIKDLLASPVPSPGERDEGPLVLSSGPLPVWHFQDDAVSGRVLVTPNAAGTGYNILQSNFNAENYISILGAPPIDGPPGIENFSKDLAFELFTTAVPEPSTILLLGLGGLAMARVYRRSKSRA